MRRLSIVLPLLLLAACSDSDLPRTSAPQGDAATLNDAAAMLDANSVSAEAVLPAAGS